MDDVAQTKTEWKVPVQTEAPSGEYALVFTDGGEVTTGELPCKPENLGRVTHINLWNNDITRIEGLEKYPNLLRLTLKSNDLRSVRGIEAARCDWQPLTGRCWAPSSGSLVHAVVVGRNLRWVDVSDNDIKDMSGMASMPHLEWLVMSNNDVSSLKGRVNCAAEGFTGAQRVWW